MHPYIKYAISVLSLAIAGVLFWYGTQVKPNERVPKLGPGGIPMLNENGEPAYEKEKMSDFAFTWPYTYYILGILCLAYAVFIGHDAYKVSQEMTDLE